MLIHRPIAIRTFKNGGADIVSLRVRLEDPIHDIPIKIISASLNGKTPFRQAIPAELLYRIIATTPSQIVIISIGRLHLTDTARDKSPIDLWNRRIMT